MSEARRGLADRLVGACLCLLLSAGLVVLFLKWWHLEGPVAREPGPEVRRGHERAAFDSLLAIHAAQTRYLEEDPDGDGVRAYSPFLVHLWQTVTPGGEKVPLGFLPKRLAFAMGPSLALDGYYFQDLRWITDGGGGREAIDLTRAWAVAAIPACPWTGDLVLLVDQTGAIFARPGTLLDNYAMPGNPEAEGWTRIGGPQDLEELR